MDTTAQNQTQQPAPPVQPQVQSVPVSAPAPPVQPVQQSVQPQSQGPSSIHKEQEIAPVSPVSAEEIVQPAEPEPKIDQEAKEAGLEVVPQRPQLTLEDKKLGITHAAESVPPFPQTTTSTQPSISFFEAEKRTKSGTWRDSFRYYYTLILKKLKREQEKVHEY